MKLFDKNNYGLAAGCFLLAMTSGAGWAAHTVHDIDGVTGPNFTFAAKAGYISTAEGNSVYFWGYANGNGVAQYPGPTMIVNQGQTVTVRLTNELTVPVSIVFPGQVGVTAAGGAVGLITREAPPGGVVTYSFVALEPGTYLYNSGTRPDLQTEMGLVGALIVRPIGYNAASNRIAYRHADSAYEHEYLFFLTEMDENIHDLVEAGNLDQVNTAKRWPVYWFINGRTGPDTVLPAKASWLPHQPYDALALIHAGDKTLMRVIGAGRDAHPFHHHGNHAKVIARDGRLLQSTPSAGADLAYEVFTIPSTPGSTYDALFQWTGEKLGWDAYGHVADVDKAPGGWASGGAKGAEDSDYNGNGVFDAPDIDNEPVGWSKGLAKGPEDVDYNADGKYNGAGAYASNAGLAPFEYAPDHGKPFPVKLPPDQDLTFGQMYSGSPFLGLTGVLPPGEGGFNPVGGFMYMWHSHAEKELCNNNIFGGGMMTFLLIAAHPEEK